MKEYILPASRMRKDYLAGTYCEIAMESFFEATQYAEKIEKNDYHAASISDYVFMERKTISTIVFSAMCIESFLNDYAATALGDDEFYDNFDKLSALSKFQLIAKFILKTELSKSEAYYGHMKALFKKRDTYVHNKSRAFIIPYTEEDFKKRQKELEESGVPFDFDNMLVCEKEELSAVIHEARDALMAIKCIAEFFDKHDHNAHAMGIFSPLGLVCGNAEEIRYKKTVFQFLDIKEPKVK